jgi:2'-5' RNA ligase
MNSHTTETIRLFYALWPDDATCAELMRLQTHMHGRLTPYENLHITLAFLGQQPVSLLPALKEVLARLPTAEFTLTLDRFGYFPRKRIAWIGMHEAPEALLSLQRDLARMLSEKNVSFDNQAAFKPHVTLARSASMPPDIVFTPIIWEVRRVALVQSSTVAEGASYRLLASRSLSEEAWTTNESGQGFPEPD